MVLFQTDWHTMSDGEMGRAPPLLAVVFFSLSLDWYRTGSDEERCRVTIWGIPAAQLARIL